MRRARTQALARSLIEATSFYIGSIRVQGVRTLASAHPFADATATITIATRHYSGAAADNRCNPPAQRRDI